jgi:2-polyprenyl-6-methoxyphenol hydroxylase-like FAD-dependent oxidoreductase
MSRSNRLMVVGAGRVGLGAALSFAGIHPKYPFMLALSQATSERRLARGLEAAGGAVERGGRMVECRNVADGVEVALEPTAGGPREVAKCPWLLAADGARRRPRPRLLARRGRVPVPDPRGR